LNCFYTILIFKPVLRKIISKYMLNAAFCYRIGETPIKNKKNRTLKRI
jgi:hypothetical protein